MPLERAERLERGVDALFIKPFAHCSKWTRPAGGSHRIPCWPSWSRRQDPCKMPMSWGSAGFRIVIFQAARREL
jgi:hypothetical protein